MKLPLNYVPRSSYRFVLDAISDPMIELDGEQCISILKYYNRGRYRFVYRDGDRVIKVIKICLPWNPYYGEFYGDAKKDREEGDRPFNHYLERKTYETSCAITRLEKKTYQECRDFLPDRIVETKYGIAKKTRVWGSYFRPYSEQKFLHGIPLNHLATDLIKIRDKPIDDSTHSMYGSIINFDRADKSEVLEGIEDFLNLFEHIYETQNGVLDFNPHNLLYTESGLVCFDTQKFHKSCWIQEDDKSPRDIYYLLKGMLEVNS